MSPRPAATRPIGKVAVAVAARPAAPVVRGKVKEVPYKTDEATGRPIVPTGYKPSPEEEYMSPLQLEYFRQRLLQWRADLVEESKQTIENLKDEVRDIGDEAERADPRDRELAGTAHPRPLPQADRQNRQHAQAPGRGRFRLLR